MTNDEQWEYCLMTASGGEWIEDKKQKVSGKLYYLSLKFLSADQVLEISLSEGRIQRDSNGKQYRMLWSYDPSMKTIGLLGQGGWKLVQTDFDDYSTTRRNHFYFKRPRKPERPANEPKIVLLPEPSRQDGFW
ncbi:MAG: hypothetical protein M1282_13155 [Chloroflexi bacterium]|nr:hypothetical protein [Chloroflexota bacterium]